MADPVYPPVLHVGRGRHRTTLRLRPHRTFIRFASDAQEGPIEDLLADFFVPWPRDGAPSGPAILAEPAFVSPSDPGSLNGRLRKRKARLVRVRAEDPQRAIIRAFLEEARNRSVRVEIASPVYVPAGEPSPTGAVAPVPATFVVTLREEALAGRAIGRIVDLGVDEDPTWPEAFGAIRRFTLDPDSDAHMIDDGYELLRQIRAVPGVLFAELDWAHVDPLLGTDEPEPPWHTSETRVDEALAGGQGDAGVTIAVIDTGFDLAHPALAGAWTADGRAFGDDEPTRVTFDAGDVTDPREDDPRWHGTAVAGLIAAEPVAETGGVAPGCSLLAVRIGGAFTDTTIAAAVMWAASLEEPRVRVMNLSLRSSGDHSSLEAAVRYAWRRGIVICAAAGNGVEYSRTRVVYPAALPQVIAVGACVQGGDRKRFGDGTGDWFSQYGLPMGVLAPGASIRTTDAEAVPGYIDQDYYDEFGGTSAAAPQVAGLAGLILSRMTAEERDAPRANAWVREAIERSCAPTPAERHYPYTTGGKPRSVAKGYGRMDAAAAVGAFG